MSGTDSQMSATPDGDHHLMARVARRYYLDDATKVQIATELGISRFKVARLLDLSRSTGMVKIELNDRGIVDDDLSQQLRHHLGLAETIVVSAHGSEDERRREVGGLAAKLLRDTLHDGDVLGLAWGRTLTAMTEELTQLPAVSVVQLTGAVGSNLAESPVEVVRRASFHAGADARAIFAPLLVEDAATASALRRQSDVASAMALFRDLTVAVVAVGSWSPPISQLREVMSEADRAELEARGVQAEVAGILIDGDGRHVGEDFVARCISISALELAKVPRVIAVAAGAEKARAVLSVARSRLISSLIVDQSLAEAILALGADAIPGEPRG